MYQVKFNPSPVIATGRSLFHHFRETRRVEFDCAPMAAPQGRQKGHGTVLLSRENLSKKTVYAQPEFINQLINRPNLNCCCFDQRLHSGPFSGFSTPRAIALTNSCISSSVNAASRRLARAGSSLIMQGRPSERVTRTPAAW